MRPQLQETVRLAVDALGHDLDELHDVPELTAERVLGHGLLALTLTVNACLEELEQVHQTLKERLWERP